MLSKLRRRLLFLLMSVMTACLVFISCSTFVSTKLNMARESESILHDLIKSDINERRPGAWPLEPQVPFFILNVDADGHIVSQSGSYYTLDDEAVLDDIVSACVASDNWTGVLPEYALRYLKSAGEDGSLRLAFADTTREASAIKAVMKNYLFIGLAVLAAWFAICFFVIKTLLKPVKMSVMRQKRFIADASHELKTPLTVILADLKLLRPAMDGLSPEQKRWWDNISSESERMKRLTEGLLEQARADGAASEKDMRRSSLSYLVSESAVSYESAIYESGLTLNYDICDDIFMMCEPEQIRQLMEALLDNARKYSTRGGNVRVKLRKSSHSKAEISVLSPGPPISDEVAKQMFDRFYRADESRKCDSESFGLGLSIASSIVAAHEGSIGVSSLGGENTFTVTLPTIK